MEVVGIDPIYLQPIAIKTNQSMSAQRRILATKIGHICQKWMGQGLPSREGLEKIVVEFTAWKQKHQVTGIWSSQPLMLTATLDDGIGQGIEIIERFADMIGLQVQPLGLMQKPAAIVAACNQYQPDFLGLTVLQLDSDDDLAYVGHRLPTQTCLIAGGPVFKFDPQMAMRCRVDYAAPDVAYFMNFLLNWHKDNDAT